MMRRALWLAKNGRGRVSPNPMVGAVITHGNRIIGEGWHRQWGGPHAEVNAVNSVAEADRHLLPEATIYVTLEPCSHYGKTPPCAKLLCECGFERVVVATPDPFPEVSGRGIEMIRNAGTQVEVGLLGEEARELNRRFITAHTLRRPYIQLKWAETADGYIASADGEPRLMISNPLSSVWMHKERADADAIMVGVNTILKDDPKLDCRLWPGRKPLNVGFESSRIPEDAHFFENPHTLRHPGESLPDFLSRLYSESKVTSLMVEGGAATLQEFIDSGLYDEVRIETSPTNQSNGIKAPRFEHRDIEKKLQLMENFECRGNIVRIYRQ